MSNNSSLIHNSDIFYYSVMSRLILWGYIGLFVSILGIIGNIITIFILLSPPMRTVSTHIYLTALSCSDIIYLLMYIPSYSMRYLINYRIYLQRGPTSTFDIRLAQVPLTFLYNIILFSNIYITIAVSIDRLISVKYPLKAKQFVTQRTTVFVIMFVYIFSIVSCIPFWFEREYNSTTKTCQSTEFGRATYQYIRMYFYIPMFCIIPFVILIYINLNILQGLIEKKQRKKSLGLNRRRNDSNITLMLVIIIIISVLCYLPLTIRNILNTFNTKVRLNPLLMFTLNATVVFINVLNTLTNFLLSCFFLQRFRQILIELCLRLFTLDFHRRFYPTSEQLSRHSNTLELMPETAHKLLSKYNFKTNDENPTSFSRTRDSFLHPNGKSISNQNK